MMPPPPCAPLFPYTTLFRSCGPGCSPSRPPSSSPPLSFPREPTPAGSTRAVSAPPAGPGSPPPQIGKHTSELQSHHDLVCRLLLEKKKNKQTSPLREAPSNL